jgi:hypothetical protein
MSTKKRKWLVAGLLLVVVIAWAMGQYDYARLVGDKRPVFTLHKSYLADGGSVEYDGVGYTVTELHELRWGIEMEKQWGSSNQVAPFRVGQKLDYWTPFISREHTRFIVETNK